MRQKKKDSIGLKSGLIAGKYIPYIIETFEDAEHFENLYNEQLEESQSTYEHLNTVIDKYREALEFYARKSRYIHTILGSNILLEMSTIDRDEGQRARKALEEENK